MAGRIEEERAVRSFYYRVVFAIIALLACGGSTPFAAEAKPEMVLQVGHRRGVNAIAVAPDGNSIVTGSGYDRFLKAWDARRDEQLWSVDAEEGETPLLFSSNGKIFLTSQYGSSSPRRFQVRLREMETGKVLVTLRGQTGSALIFSGDDSQIVSIVNRTIIRWNAKTGFQESAVTLQRIQVSPSEINYSRQEYQFSRDGRLIVGGEAANGDHTARVWDAETGKLVSYVSSDKGVYRQAAVSADGKYIATEGESLDWTPPGSNEWTSESSYLRQFTIRLWDAKTKKQIGLWGGFYSNSSGGKLLQFTKDSRALICGGDGRIEVREVSSSKLLMSLGNARSQPLSGPYILAPDESVWTERVRFGPAFVSRWDTSTGARRDLHAITISTASNLVFAPDRSSLASTGGDGTQLWDLSNGSLLRTLKGTSPNERISFLPNGLLAVSTSDRVGILETSSGKVKKILLDFDGPRRIARTFNSSPAPKPTPTPTPAPITPRQKLAARMREYYGGVLISPDGKWLVTRGNEEAGENPDVLHVWDAASETIVRSFALTDKRFTPDLSHDNSPHPRRVPSQPELSSALWLPDNRLLFPAASGINLWNLQSGKIERTFFDSTSIKQNTSRETLQLVAVSAEGSTLVGRRLSDQSLLFWRVASGKIIRTMMVHYPGAAALSPNGAFVAFADQRYLSLHKVMGGAAIFTKALWQDGTHKIAFSPDGALLAVAGEQTQIFKASNGELVLSLISFVSDRRAGHKSGWVAFTPEGYYHGSKGCEKYLRWRVGEKLFAAQKYAHEFRRPDLIQKSLQGK